MEMTVVVRVSNHARPRAVLSGSVNALPFSIQLLFLINPSSSSKYLFLYLNCIKWS